MRPTLIAATVLLPLAACNSSPTVTAQNASVAEVTAKAQAANRIEPGKWRTTVALATIELPGMPPAIADRVKARMAANANRERDTCVTPEMANKPPGEMLGAADNCRYETFKMGGGTLDAVMVCKGGGGPGEMRMTVSGDYGGARYDLATDMTMTMPGGGMKMKARVKGERVGACDAKPS